jgi:hypothetical protein
MEIRGIVRGVGWDCMYKVIPEEQLVSVKFGSRVTIHDIARYANELAADPRFDANFSEIIDLSGVEEFQIRSEEAMALADKIDPFSLQARRAFVACTEAQFHTARMHQLLRGTGKNIRIFSSVLEAREWIKDGTLGQSQAMPVTQSMRADFGK